MPNPNILLDLLSYQVVPWGFRWLRNFIIIHEPTSGVERYDDFVIDSICSGIMTGIT
jgi:hypothetical protein